MSLSNAVVKSGATAMTPTGGSDVTFNPDGTTVANGIHIADVAQTDYRIRRNATIKNKVPTLLADGTYSKDKKSISFVAPKILANGNTVFNLIRIEREVHPESTAAEALDLNMIGAQLLSDADFTNFWSVGSLA
jgi:hypothetical protein